MKTPHDPGPRSHRTCRTALGTDVEFLTVAKEIAYSHQEKWDGSGYPEGRAGEDIPLSARLMAVADVYDALISRRVYKEAMPHEDAVALIAARPGTPLRSGYRGCLPRRPGRIPRHRCPVCRFRWRPGARRGRSGAVRLAMGLIMLWRRPPERSRRRTPTSPHPDRGRCA